FHCVLARREATGGGNTSGARRALRGLAARIGSQKLTHRRRGDRDVAPISFRSELSGMPPTIQLATAQFTPIKGEYTTNVGRIGEMLARLAVLPTPPDLVHLPEA